MLISHAPYLVDDLFFRRHPFAPGVGGCALPPHTPPRCVQAPPPYRQRWLHAAGLATILLKRYRATAPRSTVARSSSVPPSGSFSRFPASITSVLNAPARQFRRQPDLPRVGGHVLDVRRIQGRRLEPQPHRLPREPHDAVRGHRARLPASDGGPETRRRRPRRRVGPAEGAHLAPPHPGHEEDLGDHGRRGGCGRGRPPRTRGCDGASGGQGEDAGARPGRELAGVRGQARVLDSTAAWRGEGLLGRSGTVTIRRDPHDGGHRPGGGRMAVAAPPTTADAPAPPTAAR